MLWRMKHVSLLQLCMIWTQFLCGGAAQLKLLSCFRTWGIRNQHLCSQCIFSRWANHASIAISITYLNQMRHSSQSHLHLLLDKFAEMALHANWYAYADALHADMPCSNQTLVVRLCHIKTAPSFTQSLYQSLGSGWHLRIQTRRMDACGHYLALTRLVSDAKWQWRMAKPRLTLQLQRSLTLTNSLHWRWKQGLWSSCMGTTYTSVKRIHPPSHGMPIASIMSKVLRTIVGRKETGRPIACCRSAHS